jgi:hypothetical protein
MKMTRQQRRLQERQSSKQTSRRKKTEVFAYDDANGVKRMLNVATMRAWAQQHLPLVGVDIDIDKVEDMLKNGRIDREHLLTHTLPAGPKPIIVCADFENGCDEIVDGNHTYMAMALAIAEAAAMGNSPSVPMRIPAYVFERDDWMRFLI